MYHPNDPLYLPDNPDMTPCRWNLNIRDCRESQVYVVGYYIITVACALGLMANAALFMRNSLYMYLLRPTSRWPPLLSLSLAYALSVIFMGIHAILLLVDVNSPYWVRELMRSIAYPFMYVGLRPYLSGLVTMAGSIDFDTVHLGLSQRTIQRLLRFIPALCFLGGIMGVLSAIGLDHGNQVWYMVFCILYGTCYLYPSILVSLCCYEYGVCFAQVVDTELQEARDQPDHPWNTTRFAGSSQGTLDGSGIGGSDDRGAGGPSKTSSPYAVEVAKALNGMRAVHRVALIGAASSGIQFMVISAMTNWAYSLLLFSEITFYTFTVLISIYAFFIIALVLVLDIRKEGLVRSRKLEERALGEDVRYGSRSTQTGLSSRDKVETEGSLETVSFSARDGLVEHGIREARNEYGGGV
ncbi:hypothetical protein BJ684DRAFT_19882 [Piptocephalis cylindrospora]|uniref:Uncharacterized protein n=1 Tax=Piptocephalis cylindrospora TaxID=1907219 RepID=A0A4P9Y3V6_9FUNG|nr:hypothetical protein BJ684DRAFT_19882 [Piptocephalis cylindrospora]|eukprot:RKP13648.1 hypothetical protein BJ684DRAFT_19882 [Piptocephalis cylindrospora]